MGKTAQIMEWNNEYEQYSEEEIKMIKHLPMKPGEIMAKYNRAVGSATEKLNLLADLNGCDRKNNRNDFGIGIKRRAIKQSEERKGEESGTKDNKENNNQSKKGKSTGSHLECN